jgi:hypothetical protein
VTYSRLSKSDSNIAKCVVCLQIMTSWDSTKVPIYKLVQRPEDPWPPPRSNAVAALMEALMPASLINHPKHWRDRAKEARYCSSRPSWEARSTLSFPKIRSGLGSPRAAETLHHPGRPDLISGRDNR